MSWVKALHIIFMVMWFAGLFYLPRLFVYHADTSDQTGSERFKIMERKLFIIMTIGGGGATLFGLWLLFAYAWTTYSTVLWLHIKLVLVLILIAYHAWLYKLMLDFRRDRNTRDHRFYRWINEFPALILFAAVILAVVKPI